MRGVAGGFRSSMAIAGAGSAAVALALLLPLVVCLAAAEAVGGAPPVSLPAPAPAGVAAVVGIPGAYLTDFRASGARFAVPWAVLAGIYRLECDFGQSVLAGCNPPGTENGAGAQGPGQFLAPTWRRGLAPDQLIAPGPPTASTADGYATDGDGDGVADVWDPADAIASTARLLADNGAGRGDLEGAVFAYNHDPAYVADVMGLAAQYEAAAPGVAAGVSSPAGAGSLPAGAGPLQPGSVATVLEVASAQLGKPYQWAGAGPATYDCSGLVMVAYGAAGLVLPHNAAEQYALTAAHAVPTAAVAPGDLVFFGPSLAGIEHVGIVVGDGQMIDAPHTGAVVRIEPYDWSDLVAATRPFG